MEEIVLAGDALPEGYEEPSRQRVYYEAGSITGYVRDVNFRFGNRNIADLRVEPMSGDTEVARVSLPVTDEALRTMFNLKERYGYIHETARYDKKTGYEGKAFKARITLELISE